MRLPHDCVRGHDFEANDSFARFGVAQFFAGQPFDGFGIGAERINRFARLLFLRLLLLYQRIQPVRDECIPWVDVRISTQQRAGIA